MSLSGTATIRSLRLRGTPGRAGACARTLALLLGAVSLLAVGEPLAAQTRDELRAASQRLRQVEGSLEALPNTGITRDVGQIAIIEHDGSNYDARIDGVLNYEARTRVGRTFYGTHADAYDFLVVFTNFPFETRDATAFHLFGRNDVQGIGKPVGSVADVFGSPSRLKGWIDMADVSQYRKRPYSLTPGDRAFGQTLNVLAHEVGHQWLAEATYKRDGVTRKDLLGSDETHWSYLLDSDASLLYGADWRDDGGGTYTAARVMEAYSALDLYLMGFLAKDKVPPVLLLQDPAVDPKRINKEGEVVTATDTSLVTVYQLIDDMGPRLPDSAHSQKEFRLGFVFLTKPGTEPSEEDLAAVEQVRRAFGAHFFALTHGVAWADTTLVETPEPPHAAVPDLQKALSWLAAQQALDGSWADSAETRLRDTAAAVHALATAGAAGPAGQRGVAWLQLAAPESLDFRARLASALGPAVAAAIRAARITGIFSNQNADGGFGAGADFASDALDTALALRALRALDQTEDARVRRAVGALSGLANPDGGWPAVVGGETSTVATAEILLALLDWSDTPGSAALRRAGLEALVARRNPDGGFGSSPSTPHATALALDVLLRAGYPGDSAAAATAWLQANQLANGSWAGSPYQTAVVLSALQQSLGPNLVVPASTLVLQPNPVEEGQAVQVTARVRNSGRAAAAATVARLFDGAPASSAPSGEASVPPLAPGEEAEVSFLYPTQDRPGTRTLSVVADAAGAVAESREDDNTASLALTVAGKLADLEVPGSAVAVTPVVPEVGEATSVAVTVTNRGERASGASVLRVDVEDPARRVVPLPVQMLPPLAPGESAVMAFAWAPAESGGHVVRAIADAAFDVPESDEANNAADRLVSVVSSVPDDAALAARDAEVVPARLEEVPEPFVARVVVENAGRATARPTVAVYDPRAGAEPVGSAQIDVGPRSSVAATVAFAVETPGDRTLRLVVDPENALPEEDEDDNTTTVRLADARTSDLELSAATLSAAEVQVGQPVTVTAEVRNRGTVDALAVPVQLGRPTSDSVSELARTAIDVPAGKAKTVSMAWTPVVAEDDVPLVVRVDPFDLLKERNEGNNAAFLDLRVRLSALPNLAVSGADIAFVPDPPVEGEPATVSVAVRNSGAAPAGPFTVRFFVGDPDAQGAPIGDAVLPGLDAGQPATATIAWSPVNARGSLGLFAVADARKEVEEPNEDDNRAFRPFQSIGLPDLVLTASDVSFEPGYPRVGEGVTVRARVLNLGGQASLATTLVLREGEPGVVIGTLAVPALAAGTETTLLLAWTPASPPGERAVSFQVDPGGLVTEQDEGNNSVRRTVVVQNADLYLTEPYFSPNGDGVKDATTLAWRGAEPATVVVSDRLGKAVRALAGAAVASGAATWDGRDDHGVVVLDGRYTLTLTAPDGRRIGALAVVLDTNRSPIHDATRPADLAIRNVTCALPDDGEQPVWLPGEDALLVINRRATSGFPIGLLRLDLDGGYSYVSSDDWYQNASLGSDRIVSPDGRQVLVLAHHQVAAVDLTTGNRRTIGHTNADGFLWSGTRWSPDGRWILVDGRVYAEDGTEVADLEPVGFGGSRKWDWSPDSTRLALGDLIVSRDGSVLHASAFAAERYAHIQATEWRRDGLIVARLSTCAPDHSDHDSCTRWLVIDPDTGTAADLGWDPGGLPAWSPDGTRAIVAGTLYDAAGKIRGRPLPEASDVSPYSGAALVRASKWDPDDPLSGQICGDKDRDVFAVTTLANLAADLTPTRLPANDGLLLYGTVGDANLDHYQLDYTPRADPVVWHPIGPALDSPAVDDQLGVFAPSEPGTYFVRLTVVDRAGNTRARTRAVSWDRVPALANLSQSEYFLSPNGDGVKDEVTFGFFVLEPTNLTVRVVGPEPSGAGAPPAIERRRETFALSAIGPRSYVWDGRDGAGQVVPDGRYAVFLNGLPFRVEVDNTPPDIGLRVDRLHVVPRSYSVPPQTDPQDFVCGAFGQLLPAVQLGTLAADRDWHVVDPHLKSWQIENTLGSPETGTEEVFDPETDAEGLPLFDPDGRPRIRRIGGRPADRVEERGAAFDAQSTGFVFEAEDHAGNRSGFSAPPVPEGVVALGAAYKCTPVLVPPVAAEGDAAEGLSPTVHRLLPSQLVLVAGASLNQRFSDQNVRFSYQAKDGGGWSDVILKKQDGDDWFLPVESFAALGVDPLETYRGRFLGSGASGEVSSDPFLFCPCREWMTAGPELLTIPPLVNHWFLVVRTQTTEPVEEVWAAVSWPGGRREKWALSRSEPGVFVRPIDPLCNPPTWEVEAVTASGRRLPAELPDKECFRPRKGWPLPPGGCGQIEIRQGFPYCGGSPDQLHLEVTVNATEGSRVDVEKAGDGALLARFMVTETELGTKIDGPVTKEIVADVTGVPGGSLAVRGRLFLAGAPSADPPIETSAATVIDRTPPTGEVLLPPEGGLLCAAPVTGDKISFQALANDASPDLEVHGRARSIGSTWSALARVCGEADAACHRDPSRIVAGLPVAIDWAASTFTAGDYQSETTFCDRSGNVTVVPRSFSLVRQPRPRVVSVARRLLSPNGDGRADGTVVIVRLAQAGLLTTRVHAGAQEGAVVRHVGEQYQPASDVAVAWDGRDDTGQAVADGTYFFVFTVTDPCGGTGEVAAAVEVDTTPPEVAITDPGTGQRVSASVGVKGQATDARFGTWELALACGAGAWSVLDTGRSPVPTGGFVASWDTSRAPPGECRLRLTAEDQAGTRSPEAVVAVQVERGDLVLSLAASPEIFSPNGDGRRETTTLEYALQRRARVRLQVRDEQGSPLRTFEDAVVHEAGAMRFGWDGRGEPNEPAVEGDHVLWIRAEDPDAPSVYEERTTRLVLDRTPPDAGISRPAAGAFVSPRVVVRGSITDPHLAEYAITATSAGGTPVEIARANEGRTDFDFGSLPELPEGPAVLQAVASDLAENVKRVDVPFVVDSIPPLARIQSPADGAFLRRGETPIPVTGLVADDHLQSWTLRFGAGAEPAAFMAIAQGETGGDRMALGPWAVPFVPDGVYTLSLVAADRAGLSTESRVTVNLDSLSPAVSLSSPAAGGYVTKPGPIVGTASDASIASWDLETAPGEAAAAYQWSPLGSGSASVTEGTLAEWSPLPPDGVYTLRLTARDKVDLSASTRTTVTVDATPPAMPAGLRAVVTKAREGYGRVVVTWDPNTEADLAGYRIEPPNGEWRAELLGNPSFEDPERVEGRHTYRVLAEDKAGNRSAAATLPVLVDLTPPLVSFSLPAEGASVAGAVDVRGTAWSADDFAEYRLLVRREDAPTERTLLRRSSLPVAAGTLGEWLAPTDGPYVLALEAEDTNGNEARVTRRVVVDTVPPEPPVLLTVAKEQPPADWLVPTWQPSPSADVIGTLVYRSGHLANATSVVLGERTGYLVPGTSYEDEKLPDGEHCYRVSAMDAAGNESALSLEKCESLDNRAPAALIVSPPDGTRFGDPVRVVAETPDLDVASVRFERRAAGAADWLGFGEVRTAPPWETTLDPRPSGGEELAVGPHELRAVATDRTGNTDPDPARITVAYGDTTPPSARVGLVARVDGTDVTLTWAPADAPDVASYRLYRDGERVAEDLTEPRHVDAGLALATYEYVVTAVDAEGNESAPSAPAEAVVYALSLEPPVWPVLSASLRSLKGDGSRAETTVSILREDAAIAQAAGTGGAFTVDGVPLVPDGNVLRARGEDGAGNRSVPSDEVVLISNAPPAAIAALGAQVDGKTVALHWAPAADADLVGYVVRRDGERLTQTVAQTEARYVEATSAYGSARRAFDGNPSTAWVPESPGIASWTVTFPAPVLVEQVRLRFAAPAGSNPGIPADYTLLALWEDRYLPVVRVRGNTQLGVDHGLPAPFLTTGLRVALDSPGGLAEVTVDRLDVVPPGTESFEDQRVPDGRHAYEVAAIDRYGAEGTPGTVDAGVGDVDAPGRPTGLVATPIVRDVQLTWNAGPEPDVARYVVVRDGSRIGASPRPSYLDPARPNGTYRYTVIAVDQVGHESGESEPADATIDLAPAPPAAPVILEPTDAAHPIELDTSHTDVAGRADPGTFVTLEADGEPRGSAPAEAGFEHVASEATPGESLAISADGRLMAWVASSDTIGVRGLPGGDRAFASGGAVRWGSLLFSPDGSQLSFSRSGPGGAQLVAMGLPDGALRVLLEGSDPVAASWSPDGRRLALSIHDYQAGGTVLKVLDAGTGEPTEIAHSGGVDTHLRWSPDGTRIAFIRNWGWGVAAELQVLEPASSRTRVLDFEAWPDAPPSWSADGHRLAWTTAAEQPLRVRVQDVEQASPTDVTDTGADLVDARFSPDGAWLSYVRLAPVEEWTQLRSIHAIHQVQGLHVTVGEPQEGYGPPDTHDWLGGRLAIRVGGQLDFYTPEAGRFVIRDVPLAPGENRLVARAADPATGLESPDSETVLVTVPDEDFPDLAVVPDGILSLPPVPLAAHDAQLRVRVENRGATDADETEVLLRVVAPGGEVVVETRAALAALVAGAESSVLLPWTPAAPGAYAVQVQVDPDGLVAEASETNNSGERVVSVLAQEGLAAEIASDRASYPALAKAHVTLRVANAGPPFAGVARTAVEDAAGSEVTLLDERAVSLEWGKTVSYELDWSVGATPTGPYAFRVRVTAPGETEPAAAAERAFAIEPGLSLLARVLPQPLVVAEGSPASLVLGVENRSTNVALDGAMARLRVRPEDTSGPAAFETVRALPSLATGVVWEATDVWPAAQPAGRYTVLLEVTRDGAVLASGAAILAVQPAAAVIRGTVTVEPGHVLAGASSQAHVHLENQGTAAVSGYPLAVELVWGPEAAVAFFVPATVDLAAGESRQLQLPIDSTGMAPGPYVVRLRGGVTPVTLDRSRLVVHGLIAPPSPHAPAAGARVGTPHPPLVVNNASSPEGATLTYEYALFADEPLTRALPGAASVAETPSRTSWTVAVGLAEDTAYWWRARASDSFSTSAWSAVASFTVDALNEPPTAPVPDTPRPGARVASLQPTLTVRNALDPERQPLTYEFRLAADEDVTQVLAAEAGVAEGLGLTPWTVTTTLEEGASYFWMARARTAGDTPEDFSPWSVPVAFTEDTVNDSPTAPTPLRPVGGVEVATHAPALVVANATDPEGDPLTYWFELDVQPGFGSPELQVSPELGPGTDETEWTPPVALLENTLYYWRARASDGNTETPSILASFFVNALNEAPGAPVPLDPVDDHTVGTSTPALRLRNAVDPEGDPLTYELEVRDASDKVVASAAGVPEGPDETTWTVTPPLGEDQAFTWSARASDGELEGEWSRPAAFRVDAVAEPPTAPVPWLPAEGAVLEERRPSLVVENATSPDHRPLTYAFELEDASGAPVESAEGIAETPDITAWTPSRDLADGGYQWRARASDPVQAGEWSRTSRFEVLVDAPPAPPVGLKAVAGDARVRLDWNASPEPDVTGYRLYRSTTAGGPYALVHAVTTNSYDDLGLTNSVTYYYVVTALDAHAESDLSNEAAARPEAPQALVAEIRYDPAVVRSECLLPAGGGRSHLAIFPADRQPWLRLGRFAAPGEEADGDFETSCHPGGCPDWVLATLELPAGHDPATIDVASLRLFGSVRADGHYSRIVDVDRDRLPERQVRFRFEDVAPHLWVGTSEATIVGRAGGSDVRGTGAIEVRPLATDMRVTPRTLRRRSCGEDVQAQITFAEGVSASKVSVGSIRLNGVVPVKRVVQSKGRDLVVKFDRAAVIGVLPLGSSVEVRVTGTLQGLPFVGVDHIRVTQ